MWLFTLCLSSKIQMANVKGRILDFRDNLSNRQKPIITCVFSDFKRRKRKKFCSKMSFVSIELENVFSWETQLAVGMSVLTTEDFCSLPHLLY